MNEQNLQEFARKYFDLIWNEFSGINLTAIDNFDEFYSKQILDSVLPAQKIDFFSEKLVHVELILDVGFGGGFPILPLAKIFPEKKFFGIEARNKKVDVVRIIAERLHLKNVSLYHGRLEDILIDVNAVITFKAVGKIKDMIAKINATKEVTAFFYKGPHFSDKENFSTSSKSNEGWKIVSDSEIDVPGTEGRRLIGVQIVPRGTKRNHKFLVKLSDLLIES